MRNYFVYYNGAFIADFYTFKGASNYCKRRNMSGLVVYDRGGVPYNPANGEEIEDVDEFLYGE